MGLHSGLRPEPRCPILPGLPGLPPLRPVPRPVRPWLLLLLVLLLLAAACAATTLRSVWQREGYTGGPFRTLLVMGISEHAGARALYEEVVARELAAHGVRTLQSSVVLPEIGAVTPARVRRWVRELGIDGVLTTHLVGIRVDVEYVPPTWHPWLWDYYDYRWHTMEPGYLRQSETVVLETNLYDTRGQLVWSAVSETFNPESRDRVIDEVSRLVTEELASRNLVPPVAATAESEGEG